jgi:hypothetical protein
MNRALQYELQELVDEVAPPLIDLDELQRLVAQDDAVDPSEGECTIHEGCRPVFPSRFR